MKYEMERGLLAVAVLAAGVVANAMEIKSMDKIEVKQTAGVAPDSWFSHLAFEVLGENCRTDWQEPVMNQTSSSQIRHIFQS